MCQTDTDREDLSLLSKRLEFHRKLASKSSHIASLPLELSNLSETVNKVCRKSSEIANKITARKRAESVKKSSTLWAPLEGG